MKGRKLKLAVVGLGRLGRACVEAIGEAGDLELAGIVRRAPVAGAPGLPREVRTVGHLSELGAVDAALVCVPAALVGGVAAELLQRRTPVVECARLEGQARVAQREALRHAADRHRTPVVVGAGWEPGVAERLAELFERLLPRGATRVSHRPAVDLHHAPELEALPGVRAALAGERREAGGERCRWVYLETAPGANLAGLTAAVEADPLWAGAVVRVFAVASVAELETHGHGIVLERLGLGGGAAHDSLLLEGRFDPHALAARVMIDAARRLPGRAAGLWEYQPWM